MLLFYISMVLGMICSPAGCLVRALSLSGCRGLGENSIPSPTPTAVYSKIPLSTLQMMYSSAAEG